MGLDSGRPAVIRRRRECTPHGAEYRRWSIKSRQADREPDRPEMVPLCAVLADQRL